AEFQRRGQGPATATGMARGSGSIYRVHLHSPPCRRLANGMASSRAGHYGVHGRGRRQPTTPCRQGLAGGSARQEDRHNLGNLSSDVTLCLEPANGSAEGSKGLV